MFEDTPIAIPLSFENTKFPTIEDKMRTLIRNREEALAAHELARNRMADRRRSTFTPFKLGDRVWLDTRNLKTNHHKKIGPRREGPFKITRVIGPVMYQLELPRTWRIHNVFHATQAMLWFCCNIYLNWSQNHVAVLPWIAVPLSYTQFTDHWCIHWWAGSMSSTSKRDFAIDRTPKSEYVTSLDDQSDQATSLSDQSQPQ